MIDHLTLTKHRAFFNGKMEVGTFTAQGFICHDGTLIKVNRKAIGIYIGLKTRKGKRVYTGDILEIYERSKRVCVVRYLKDGACFVLTGLKENGGLVNINLTAPYCLKCKLVGNIYQDRKLSEKLIKKIMEV